MPSVRHKRSVAHTPGLSGVTAKLSPHTKARDPEAARAWVNAPFRLVQAALLHWRRAQTGSTQ